MVTMMKNRLVGMMVMVVMVAVVMVMTVNAASIDVKLTPAPLAEGQDVAPHTFGFIWTLVNFGDEPVDVAVWGTPFGFHGAIDHSIFSIFPVLPSDLPFPRCNGIVAKSSAEMTFDSSTQWIHLEPGTTFSRFVTIARHFEFFQPGNYTARFSSKLYFSNTPLSQKKLPFSLNRMNDFEIVFIESNDVEFFVSQSLIHSLASQFMPQTPHTTERIAYNNCAAHAGVLSDIIANFIQGVSFCYNRLLSMDPRSQSSRDSNYYDIWFGHLGTGNIQSPYVSSSDTYTSVLDVYSRINNLAQSGNFVVSCENCANTIGHTDVFAYVVPTDSTHTIHMCNELAFSGSNQLRIPDSVPGVLVHETSHFFSTLDRAYGTTNSKALVSGCRSGTYPLSYCSDNADNYEYFSDSKFIPHNLQISLK